jgi:hypothetical protein
VSLPQEVDVNRTLLLLAVVAAAASALLGATLAPAASAQDLSPGCQLLNGPLVDGVYIEAVLPSLEYAAGDRILASAGPPSRNFVEPTSLKLLVGNDVVDTAPYPGTLEYVFPAAGTHVLDWSIVWSIVPPVGLGVTWTVSCIPAPAAPEIADLQGLVAASGLHHGIANALDSKLRAALAALEVGDTAGACDSLQAFLNQASAQSGNKLTPEQAQQFTEETNEIRTFLAC